MANKITFLAKIFIIILSITLSSYALELKIVPLKKPVLNEEIKKNLEQKAKDNKNKIKLIFAKKIESKLYFNYSFF